MGQEVILKMAGIEKRFSGIHALRSMQFELKKGEIHALMGENGAGKSTLIKILGGIYEPDAGQIEISGHEVRIKDVQYARNMGINIIHQEICLVPYLTVAENIFLGREETKMGGIRNTASMERKAQKILDELQIEILSGQAVCQLTIAQQQLVEIAKAVSFDTKILVMDEPTSSLSLKETQQLFEIMARLKNEGVSILYVSHRMEEIFTVCDRVTVMRDGSYIATHPVQEITTDEIVKEMVGRKIENYYVRDFNSPGEKALEVKKLGKKKTFWDVSFSVRQGEIVGFAGLVGSGRSEIMLSIFGADTYDEGQIFLSGKELIHPDTRRAIQEGIALVPENRKEQGLILVNTVGYNLTLASLKKILEKGLIRARKRASFVQKYFSKLKIKARSENQRVSELSGGNQQKVVLSKWLATEPKVLIVDEPTRGVDVGAKAEIYSILNELAKSGIAVLMVSSELTEIINMCDRAYVVHEGRITGELYRSDFSQDKIMYYATGGSHGADKNQRRNNG